MNHAKTGRKFGRKKGARQAFLKGLANNLIKKGRIITTVARAKEIRPIVEKLVTKAKKQNVATLRLLLSRLDKPAAEKLYYELAKKYESRSGGYLRITKSDAVRLRDGSSKAKIEFV